MTAPLAGLELAVGNWADVLTPITANPITYTLTLVSDSTSWGWVEGDSYDVTWTLTIGGGTQTDVYVTIYWQDDAGFNNNAIDNLAEFTTANPGWTVIYLTDFGSYYAAQLYKASVPVGASTIYLPFAPLYDGVGDYDAGVHGPIQATAQSIQKPTPYAAADMTITVTAPAPSYTIDSTSGHGFPADATEHAAFETVVGSTMGAPDVLWNCQETSGNATDTSGAGRTGTVSAATYAQTVAGFTRKAMTFAAGAGGISTVSVPNFNANSLCAILIAEVTSITAASQGIVHGGTSNIAQIRFTTTPRMQHRSAGNVATGTISPTGGVRCWALNYNRTAGIGGAYNNLEKVIAAYVATVTGASFNIGGGPPPNMKLLYVIAWFSAKTEAQIKTWLQGAGWTIPW